MQNKEILQIMTQVAWKMYGLPYRWGGDDTIDGFDCSGMCIEIMKSVGILPRSGDWTAHSLWERFSDKRVKRPEEGCFVCWKSDSFFKKGRVIHIEYCLNNELSIGASGGGSKTKNKNYAAIQNAFVKVRPFESRSGIAGFFKPF